MLDFRWIEDTRDGRAFGTWFYPEDVLSDHCPQFLHLKDVSIWRKGPDRKGSIQTGLDVTHNHIQKPKLAEFFGVLTIEKTYWLKREAKIRLSALVEERHQRRTIGEDPTNLDEIYSEDETIDIRVKCIMSDNVLQPQCYSADKHPEHLLFHSLDKRSWIIANMDVYSFKHSRNYYHRHSVLALLKDIAFPPDPSNPKSIALPPPKVSYEQRTPEWFVDEYLQRYANSNTHIHSRFQFLPTRMDQDVEVSESEHERFTTTLRKTKITRFPRHVSKAEVRAQLARCAEWILAEQCLKRSDRREVNLAAWDSYIKHTVRPGRRLSKYTWGMPLEGMRVPELPGANLSDDLRDVYIGDYCSLDAATLRRKLRTISSQSQPTATRSDSQPVRSLPRRLNAGPQGKVASSSRKAPLPRAPSPLRLPSRRRRSPSSEYAPTSPVHPTNRLSSPEIPPTAQEEPPSPFLPPESPEDIEAEQEPTELLRPHYDSDFSNPDDSDCEQQSDSSSIDDIDPELILPIPRSCFFDYDIVPGSLTWKCDVKKCSWSVSKLQLYQREEEKMKNGGIFARLDRAGREAYVETQFVDVVEDHQIGHLVKWGIGMRWDGPKAVLYWKRPREHKKYPYARNRYGAKTERLLEDFESVTLS